MRILKIMLFISLGLAILFATLFLGKSFNKTSLNNISEEENKDMAINNGLNSVKKIDSESISPSVPKLSHPDTKNVAETAKEKCQRVRYEIIEALHDIDVNTVSNRQIASNARDIVKNRINELPDNSAEYKWFQDNIINAIDAAAASNVRNMVKRGWNPF